MSWDTHMRNLTLAQENDDLVLRLRTQQTDLNGLLAGAVRPCPRGFSQRALVVGRASYPSGQLTLDVDGQPAVVTDLPPAVLQTWDPAFSLALSERDDLRSALARRDLRRRGQGAGSRARLRGC